MKTASFEEVRDYGGPMLLLWTFDSRFSLQGSTLGSMKLGNDLSQLILVRALWIGTPGFDFLVLGYLSVSVSESWKLTSLSISTVMLCSGSKARETQGKQSHVRLKIYLHGNALTSTFIHIIKALVIIVQYYDYQSFRILQFEFHGSIANGRAVLVTIRERLLAINGCDKPNTKWRTAQTNGDGC